jgi:predicted ribosomally synthesized peptide with nif11-like leader
MSLESLQQQFYQRVLEDPALQERVRRATSQESLVRLMVRLGQENGYDFTVEEVRQRMEEEWIKYQIHYPIENLLNLPAL